MNKHGKQRSVGKIISKFYSMLEQVNEENDTADCDWGSTPMHRLCHLVLHLRWF
jgi:hypothetical protein